MLRQECSEGTVFGVLTTPKCQRKAAFHERTTVTYQEDLSASSLRGKGGSSLGHSVSAYGIEEYRRPRLSAVDYRTRSFLEHSHSCCYRDRAAPCFNRPPQLWRYDGRLEGSAEEPRQRDSVTHCVNPNVRVSRQVLSDNFQDFCQTMLASERQVLETPRINSSTQTPDGKTPPQQTGNSQVSFRLGTKDSPRRTSLSSLSRTSIVQEMLKKMSSQTVAPPTATAVLTHERPADTNGTEDTLDQDTLKVIQQLDMSIAGEEAFVDGPPPPVFPRSTDVPMFPCVIGSPVSPNGTSTSTDTEAQKDNLIEEVCLPGSNKKTYQPLTAVLGEEGSTIRSEVSQLNGNRVTQQRNGLINKNNGLDIQADIHANGGRQVHTSKTFSEPGDICVMPGTVPSACYRTLNILQDRIPNVSEHGSCRKA